MRVRDGDRQRIGGVGRFRLGLRQQDLQHHQDLVLVGMAGADHGLLHLVRGVFRDRDPEHRRRQHRDPARLPEFQRGDAVLVDKGLFDRGLRRLEIAEHGGKPLMDRQQAARQRQAVGRLHRAAADENQPVAVDLDHAPAGAAQARIDAKDADGVANRRRCHGVLTPCRSLKPSAGEPSYPAKANLERAPGRCAARSDALQSRGPFEGAPRTWVPALRSSAEGALHRVRDTGSTRPSSPSARRKPRNWRRRSGRRRAR